MMLMQVKTVSPPAMRYSAFSTVAPNASGSNQAGDSTGDIFVKTASVAPAAPRFSGWGFVKPTIQYGLPFASALLSSERKRIDRAMERDDRRREDRQYERRKTQTWEKLGTPRRRWISRHRYEIVTPVTVKDGNGRTLDHYNRVEGPYRV